MSRYLQHFSGFFKAFALTVECGMLLLLWKRSTLILCLAGCILFHLGVFAMSGIFFGMWVTIEVAIIAFVLTSRGKHLFAMRTKRHFFASIALILIGTRLFQPVILTWYDSPLNYTYHFEVIGESGTPYYLDNTEIAPYDYQFTLGGFSFLSKDEQLPVTWGSTGNREFAEHMRHATDQSVVDQAYDIYAKSGFNPISTQKFDQFLQSIIINHNERGTKNAFPYILDFPPHLWRAAPSNPFRNQEVVQRIDVIRSTTLFDRTDYKEIDKKIIHSIDLTSTN